MKKILLVEDSTKTQMLVFEALKNSYIVVIKDSTKEAEAYLKTSVPDLILLDINLPREDGISFYSKMTSERHQANIPTIFLTAKDEISHKISAFKLGAVDYIIKPFDPVELVLRVDSHLRPMGSSNIVYFDEKYYIDKSIAAVFSVDAGEANRLDISPIEYKLLSFFITNPDQIFSRDQIFDHVWGHNTHCLERTIDRHLSTLKKKIPILKRRLRSVYGSGYVFEAPSLPRQTAS